MEAGAGSDHGGTRNSSFSTAVGDQVGIVGVVLLFAVSSQGLRIFLDKIFFVQFFLDFCFCFLFFFGY
jgi:hypothetical protein